jgi:hypothetical protein
MRPLPDHLRKVPQNENFNYSIIPELKIYRTKDWISEIDMPDFPNSPVISATERRLTITGFVFVYIGLMSLAMLASVDNPSRLAHALIEWISLPGIANGIFIIIAARLYGRHRDRRK